MPKRLWKGAEKVKAKGKEVVENMTTKTTVSTALMKKRRQLKRSRLLLLHIIIVTMNEEGTPMEIATAMTTIITATINGTIIVTTANIAATITGTHHPKLRSRTRATESIANKAKRTPKTT